MAKIKYLDKAFEIKNIDEKGVFTGYGSVFDEVDSVKDRVIRGAYHKTLERHKAKGTMPVMLWQHNSDEPIGCYLDMHEDEKGLYVEGQLALKVQRGLEVYELMKMNVITGLSIGYAIPPGGEKYDKTTGVNDLTEIDLWELSPCVFPCGDSARVNGVKNDLPTEREVELILRDAGISRTNAKIILAKGYDGIQRDADTEVVAELNKLIEKFKN